MANDLLCFIFHSIAFHPTASTNNQQQMALAVAIATATHSTYYI